MFYCDSCADEKGWPIGMMRSRGPCEVCGETRVCTSRKSSLLPPPAGADQEALDAIERSLALLGGKPASEALEEARRVAGKLKGSATIDPASLPPAARRALEGDPDLLRTSIRGVGSARRSLLSGGGSAEPGSRHETERGVSLPEEALERVIEGDEGSGAAHVHVPVDAPPPPPRVPSFTRFLSGEGFARWCKRMPLGDDPALNAHCIETRRRWHRYSVAFQRGIDRLLWPFPAFTPAGRPFDWKTDA